MRRGRLETAGFSLFALFLIVNVTVTLTDDAPGTATATGSASVAAAAVPTLRGLGLLALTLLLAAAGVLMFGLRGDFSPSPWLHLRMLACNTGDRPDVWAVRRENTSKR